MENTMELVYAPSKNITDGDLVIDREQLKNAKIATLNGQLYFTYRAAEIFAQHAQFVHTLDFSNNDIGDIGAMALGQIPTLRSLCVSNCKIVEGGAYSLLVHPGLHRLCIDGNPLTTEVLKIVPENNSLHYLKISCTKDDLAIFSQCTLKTLDLVCDNEVSAQDKQEIAHAIALNREQCKQFLKTVSTVLLVKKNNAPNLALLQKDLILDICFALGRHLPKTPVQIAFCIVLLNHRINGNYTATRIDAPLKAQAFTLLQRHYNLEDLPSPPNQYIDDAPLTLLQIPQ